MKERVEMLRRKIRLYRRYLSEGVDADLALDDLREILLAESELAQLDKDTDRQS